MAQFSSAVLGAVVGVVGFSVVIGSLDDLFRPYPDDMSMWLLYSLPAGALFGCLSGWALAAARRQKGKLVGGVVIPLAVVLAVVHGMLIWDSMQRLRSPSSMSRTVVVYAFAQCGPGLLWALVLVGFGVSCVLKRGKA